MGVWMVRTSRSWCPLRSGVEGRKGALGSPVLPFPSCVPDTQVRPVRGVSPTRLVSRVGSSGGSGGSAGGGG